MAQESLSSTFTGRVASVNERGLRLDGHDTWLNCSKFAPPIIMPERGATVTVSVDSKGFLRSCMPATDAPAPLPVAGGSFDRTSKDVTITRLAVLKAAAEFSASKPTATSADVLKIAASWERWVSRSDDPAEDLAEAF